MLSPYRISTSSKSHTRKQKISNHTEHDLKMTSKGVIETDKPVSKEVKTKNNDSNDSQNNGG